MNLTEKLGGLTRISTQKRVSNVLILALGLLGLMIIGTAIWLSFTDWRHSGLRSSAESESRQAIEDLAVPVKSLKRIMNDEQVQILALRALKDEHKLADL